VTAGPDIDEPPLVHRTVAGGVATVTLDSPHNRNALSVRLMTQLRRHLEAALADDAIRVVVLSHTGRVFCSGADLSETQAGSDAADIPVAALPAILRLLWDSTKPVVARVGGAVRAGGLGLLGACDLVVTAEDATFAFTEVRLGVVPAVVSATVLPRLTPRAAAELMLTGDVFDGRRAAEIGLVSAAVPADRLDATVARWTNMLIRGGPAALAATKALLRRPASDDLSADLIRLSALSVQTFTSAEGREGVTAFREKRDAWWVPRE